MKAINTLFVFTKRTSLFILTNFIIILSIGFIGQFFLGYMGINSNEFLIYLIIYSIMGMGGAFISLWISKWLAVKFMKVKVISSQNSEPQLRVLVEKVHHLAHKAGLNKKPEVGVFESPDVNAFATGPSKNNSLVACSTGLLEHMDEEQIEGVLAHEISHIANGDMVTMTLVQGVVNVMVYLLAHIMANIVSSSLSRGRNNWFLTFMIRQLFVTLLYIPGSMIVCFFSRWREFRADHGGAVLAGRQKMVSALQALQSVTQKVHPQKEKTSYSYLQINNTLKPTLLSKLFSTHPPLEERIERLNQALL